MKTREERGAIAAEIVRRADTVTLLTPAEVLAIHKRAQAGEFDTIFDEEPKRTSRARKETV